MGSCSQNFFDCDGLEATGCEVEFDRLAHPLLVGDDIGVGIGNYLLKDTENGLLTFLTTSEEDVMFSRTTSSENISTAPFVLGPRSKPVFTQATPYGAGKTTVLLLSRPNQSIVRGTLYDLEGGVLVDDFPILDGFIDGGPVGSFDWVTPAYDGVNYFVFYFSYYPERNQSFCELSEKGLQVGGYCDFEYLRWEPCMEMQRYDVLSRGDRLFETCNFIREGPPSIWTWTMRLFNHSADNSIGWTQYEYSETGFGPWSVKLCATYDNILTMMMRLRSESSLSFMTFDIYKPALAGNLAFAGPEDGLDFEGALTLECDGTALSTMALVFDIDRGRLGMFTINGVDRLQKVYIDFADGGKDVAFPRTTFLSRENRYLVTYLDQAKNTVFGFYVDLEGRIICE